MKTTNRHRGSMFSAALAAGDRVAWPLLAIAVLICACPGALRAQQAPPITAAGPPLSGQAQPAKPVEQLTLRSWGYQLSNVDPDLIAASDYDAVVIDYARDGTQGHALTADEIARLKVKPDGTRRLVLAYLSIGEAEQYRYYWNKRWNWWWGLYRWLFGPSWIGRENPEWRGNFAVRYWLPEWQALIAGPGESYLGRIIAAGFDGAWLDKVDASNEDVARKIENPAEEMVKFIAAIAARARAEKPRFLLIPQNGEHLLSFPVYRTLIDGMGAESLLYGDPVEKKPTSKAVQKKRIPALQSVVADGKPVLAVEYLDNPAQIAAARDQLQRLGFVPHFADRALDTMRMTDLPDGADSKQ